MRILLIDDDADSQLLVRLLLESEGFLEVAVATSAATGLALAQAHAATLNLVLMNVQMPGIDGIEAVRRLKVLDAVRDVPVIMLTTQTEPQVLEQAYAAGAFDYVRKPVERTELLVRVRSALALKDANDRRRAREHELVALTQRLETTLRVLNADLAAAARLQRGLLPDPRQAPAGVAWRWRFIPCAAIGGDLLNAAEIAPGVVGFHLLDVAGHGVPAALFCVGLHRLLSAGSGSYLVAEDGHPHSAVEVVSRLNRDFQMTQEVPTYFTIIYATVNVDSGALSYVQAGHPGMVLIPPGEPAAFAGAGDLPVGLFPQTPYHAGSVALPRRSRVLLYSDGLIEAEQPLTGELFGQQRLLSHIEQLRHLSLDDLLDGLVYAVTEWTKPGAQSDDVSLLAVELI